MCKDPALTYLNGLGYNVIRHPRAAIAPLYLIGRKDGATEGLGALPKLLKSRQPEPAKPMVSRKEPSAAITGQTTGELDLAVGLGILNGFLKGLGVDADVSAAFSGGHKLKFSFGEVVVERAEPLDIGAFLVGAEADLENPVVRTYLRGGGRLYVLHEVLKSAQVHVLVADSRQADLQLKVPVLQQALGGKAQVGAKSARENSLSFTGDKPLAFGFKCLQIWLREKDGRAVFEAAPAPPKPGLHLHNPSLSRDDPNGPLLIRDELVELPEPLDPDASAAATRR